MGVDVVSECIASAEAKELSNRGFESNGCGAVGSKKWVAYFLTHLFSFDFSEECYWHDIEYSLSRTIKTRKRKMEADSNFEINLRNKLKSYPENLSPLRKIAYAKFKPYKKLVDWAIENLPSLYHAAVVAGGRSAYWS